MTNNKSVILLSGGLDSAVSLANCIQSENIKLALFFNYGQKSFQYEYNAAKKLADYYKVKLELIELDWLKKILNNSLVNDNLDLPKLCEQDLDNSKKSSDASKNVWISNRNGLFINIAACYADSFEYNKIIIGANKEEANTFKDNSLEFIEQSSLALKFSTQIQPEVFAPLINLDKQEIIELANELNLPFNIIHSCYSNTQNHCGKCESCLRLKRGLERAGLFDILNLIFTEKE